MNSDARKYLSELVLIVMIIIIGFTIVVTVGLINNNFFPTKSLTEIVLTKSPLKIIYKGNQQVSLEELVKDAKDFPFVNYNFNDSLYVDIKTREAESRVSDTKISIKETGDEAVATINKDNKENEHNIEAPKN